MEEHDDLEARLRQIGTHPVDPASQADHLARIAGVRPRSSVRPKLRVAAAFLAGLLIGGSGLAAADALPDPVQHVAHRTLDPLGIDVPDPERYHGPECGDAVKRNHGAYVRDDHALAKSQCGKPVHAGGGDDEDEPEDKADKAEKGPCDGPPPWAGGGKSSMTAEEKAAAKAARAAECGDEPSDEDEPEDEADDAGADERSTAEDEATTTTAAPTTTTTAPTTTTTLTTTSLDGAAGPEAGR